jgi:hypothetical protein
MTIKQAKVNPGKNKDGKLSDTLWFDVSRLEITSKKRVMEIPQFEYVDSDVHGAENKPMSNRF